MNLGICFLFATILVVGATSNGEDVLTKLLQLVQQKRHQAKAMDTCGINKYNNQMQKRGTSALERLLRKVLSGEEMQEFKRISMGRVAKVAEFPWIAFISIELTEDASSRCGATLINDQWVLTAAHCFFGEAAEGYPPIKDMNKIAVYLGEYNTDENVKEPSERRFKPEKIIVHPQYDVKDVTTNRNDIALVKLPTKVSFNENIKLPCLPTGPLPAGTTCYAAGWGVNEDGKIQAILKTVKLVSITNEACQNDRGHTIYEGTLCAGAPPGVNLADACQGDSGGPLSCLIDGKFYIAGATSYGVKCASKEKAPGVYTDVHYYMKWVKSVVDGDGGKPGNGNGLGGDGDIGAGNWGDEDTGNGNFGGGDGNGGWGDNDDFGNGDGDMGYDDDSDLFIKKLRQLLELD